MMIRLAHVRWGLIFLALVAAVLIAFRVATRTPAATPTHSPGASATPEPETPHLLGSVPRGGAAERPKAAHPAPARESNEGLWRLQGVVLDSGMHGVGGTDLTILLPTGRVVPIAGGTTPSGAFSIGLDKSHLENADRIRLQATRAGSDLMAVSGDLYVRRDPRDIVLVLRRTSCVRVRLTVESGAAAPGGDVVVVCLPGGPPGESVAAYEEDRLSFTPVLGRTDAQGLAEFRVRPGRVYVRGRVSSEAPWVGDGPHVITRGEARDVVLRGALRGSGHVIVVRDETGSPVAGAWVQVSPRERLCPPPRTVPTGVDAVADEAGVVRLPPLDASEFPLRLAAGSPRHVPRGAVLVAPPQSGDPLLLVLAGRPVVRLSLVERGSGLAVDAPVDWGVVSSFSDTASRGAVGSPEEGISVLTGPSTVEHDGPGRWSAYVVRSGPGHVRGRLPGGLSWERRVDILPAGTEVRWEVPRLVSVVVEGEGQQGIPPTRGALTDGVRRHLSWSGPAGASGEMWEPDQGPWTLWLPAEVQLLNWKIGNRLVTGVSGTVAIDRSAEPATIRLPKASAEAMNAVAARVEFRFPSVGGSDAGPYPPFVLSSRAGGAWPLSSDAAGKAVVWLPPGVYSARRCDGALPAPLTSVAVDGLAPQEVRLQ